MIANLEDKVVLITGAGKGGGQRCFTVQPRFNDFTKRWMDRSRCGQKVGAQSIAAVIYLCENSSLNGQIVNMED